MVFINVDFLGYQGYWPSVMMTVSQPLIMRSCYRKLIRSHHPTILILRLSKMMMMTMILCQPTICLLWRRAYRFTTLLIITFYIITVPYM